MHWCLVLCYDQGSTPQSWRTSETFCIFKGKGSWQDPDRWRPIAMSNCIYRLLTRWCYKTLYPLLSPLLHSRQFGGRQGISTSHATQAFLNVINTDTPWESIFAFDMYHAFDSPSKILIREDLERMRNPAKLLRKITTVLEHGSTFIRGSPDEIFRTTNGVKQGCRPSCFLFVLVFEIPLWDMQSQGLVFSAYVDGVSTPVPPSQGPRTAEIVQRALNLIGCQLNVVKSEALPLCKPQPLSPSLAKYRHPLAPLQASSEFWLLISFPSLPEWADTSEQPLKQVSYLLHLGHPLPAHVGIRRGFPIIADELLGQLADLNSHPIQTLDGALLANTVIIPRVLYRSGCFPLDSVQLSELSNAIGVSSLELLVYHLWSPRKLSIPTAPMVWDSKVWPCSSPHASLIRFTATAGYPACAHTRNGQCPPIVCTPQLLSCWAPPRRLRCSLYLSLGRPGTS